MKKLYLRQKITTQQATDLTESEKTVLLTWYRSIQPEWDSDMLPLFTIGQLIYFLWAHKTLYNFHALDGCYDMDDENKGWHVVLKNNKKLKNDTQTIEEDELIDGLWEGARDIAQWLAEA